jgi:pimeloyl-ACP methyl ester carboxylesterase
MTEHQTAPTSQPLTLASGMTLHALRWAPTPATASSDSASTPRRVLALHGWLDNAASFSRLAPLLTPHGFEVVALDLPGHGHSDHKPLSARYHFIDWPLDALDALDALGWPDAIVLGHSMGAGIAALAASLAPERVKRLIMLDGIGPLTSEAADAPELARHNVQEARSTRPMSAYPDLDTLAARRAQAFGATMRHDSALRLVTRGSAPTSDGRWRQRHDPRLRSPSLLRLTEAHVQAFFHDITCPTLLFRALDGWPAPDDLLRDRLSYLRNASPTCVEIPGGHHVHLDDPDALLPALLPFLLHEP